MHALVANACLAGGYDAVFVVALDECVLDRIEELWIQWPQTHPSSTYVHVNQSLGKLTYT